MHRSYIVSVPLMNHLSTEKNRPLYLQDLRRAGASRVFLCVSRYFGDSPQRQEAMALLRDNIQYYEAAGLETGVWLAATLGHGGRLEHEEQLEEGTFTPIVGFSGSACEATFCPADPNFQEVIADEIQEIAKAGAKLIMLDDDFRLGYRGNGMGCTCDRHLALFEKICGKAYSRESLWETLFSGAPTPLRTQWLDLMHDTMLAFAHAMRAALNAINPSCRLGFCAAPSSFDPEGTDAIALTRAFAGDTRPFIRCMGAPYWQIMWGGASQTLADVIGYERIECRWVREHALDIEVFSEGDVYPRPRYRIPAWLLEGFDTALRAAGGMDGILKYMFDYVHAPSYETGYTDRHIQNQKSYREIEQAFSAGITRGIYVYEEEHKVRDAVFDGTAVMELLMNSSLSVGVKLLNRTSTPMADSPCGDAVLVTGENARNMPLSLLENGTILDIISAEILSERGIDVGITAAETAIVPQKECFAQTEDMEAEEIHVEGGIYYHTILHEAAEVSSTFITADGKHIPAAWYYENAAGQRFFVYNMDLSYAHFHTEHFLSYCRQRQLHSAVRKLQKQRPLAVSCTKEPGVYLLVKDDAKTGTRAVGVWNFGEDTILTPRLHLDREFNFVQFLSGAEGYLEKDTVTFQSNLPAHAFAGFLVR